jgi:hypothetical protein
LTAVAVAVAVQLLLPERLSLGPGWLLPAIEGAVALPLVLAEPLRIPRESARIRRACRSGRIRPPAAAACWEAA